MRFELPRIDYARRNGREHRYVWGMAPRDGELFGRVVKVDVAGGGAQAWDEPGSYPGEPVFVARPDGEGEDDGVLLSVVLEPERGQSSLLVLDAARPVGAGPRARAPPHPVRVPRPALRLALSRGLHARRRRGAGRG